MKVSYRAVNFFFLIFVEFKVKIHIRMQKCNNQILDVRQAALYVAHKIRWR